MMTDCRLTRESWCVRVCVCVSEEGKKDLVTRADYANLGQMNDLYQTGPPPVSQCVQKLEIIPSN